MTLDSGSPVVDETGLQARLERIKQLWLRGTRLAVARQRI
jgi:hypothetical protein